MSEETVSWSITQSHNGNNRIRKLKLKEGPRAWWGWGCDPRRDAVLGPRVIAWLWCLLPDLPREVTPSLQLPGHAGVQLQVCDVLLDPGLPGLGTDLLSSFG